MGAEPGAWASAVPTSFPAFRVQSVHLLGTSMKEPGPCREYMGAKKRCGGGWLGGPGLRHAQDREQDVVQPQTIFQQGFLQPP